VPIEDIRLFMLELFQKWTLPKYIRTDNGEPFGIPTRDVIPIMSLWLKAYGITPILNTPRQPTQNAKVERGQGTTSRWAEVETCPNIEQLYLNLEEACTLQREKYPVARLGKVTRAQLHKSLFENPRPYEKVVFNENEAYIYLSLAVMPRKVSASGNITIYSKTYSVGKCNAGEIMMLKFNPNLLCWNVINQKGAFCKALPDARFKRDKLFMIRCQ
jgi:hypothetical protein